MRRSTSRAKAGTLIRPSDRLRRGEVDLDGLDLTQPLAVKEHLFGQVLRVDQVQPEGREPLALELESFVAAVRTGRARRSAAKTACAPCAWPTRSCAA